MAGRSQVFKGTAAYGVVSIGQRAIGFLLLPLYAQVLTPAEYGQIAVIVTLGGLVLPILTFGLETPLFRDWFRLSERPRERRQVFAAVQAFLWSAAAGASALFGLFIVVFRPDPIMGLAPSLVFIEVLSVSIFVGTSVVPFTMLRAQEALREYVIVNAAYATCQTATKVAFVLLLDMGVAGYVYSDLAAAVALLGLLAYKRLLPASRWSWSALRPPLRIGLPLLPHTVSHWALALSDRFVLAALVSSAALGLYGMAYQVAIVAQVVVVELNRSFMPSYGRLLQDEEPASHLRALMQRQIQFVLGICGLAVLLLPSLMLHVLPSEYAPAAGYVPSVLLGVLFLGLYMLPMNYVSIVVGRTALVGVVTGVAALTNLVLNLLLVPSFGVQAAGYSTAAAYAVLLVGLSLMAAAHGFRAPSRWSVAQGLTAVPTALAFIYAIFVPASAPAEDAVARVGASALLILATLLVGTWTLARSRPPLN